MADQRASWEGTPVAWNRPLQGLLAGYVLLWSGLAISPVDRGDWLLENILAITFVIALVLSSRRFQFSNHSYILMTIFLSLHAIGAHYTYAKVPFGFWLQDLFGLSRNPFDRIVHFGYGLLLAYPFRELLIRLACVRGWWTYYLPVSAMLAQSGLFEVIEGLAAYMVSPELGTAYLGTQGDEWDAQKDMTAAIVGAFLAMLVTLLLSNVPPKGPKFLTAAAGRHRSMIDAQTASTPAKEPAGD
jgi:putative membrane protein